MLQDKLVEALMDPETYDEGVLQVKLIQTHISYIFLTGRYAYKVKKSVNFGFLDFTTLEKRKHYCEEEVRLNRRLCGDMYLGVLPITLSGDKVKINGKEKVTEYTVKMKEIPQNTLMSQLLKENKVSKKHIDEMAKILSDFHNEAETNEEIERYGHLNTIRFNWEENFDQTRRFISTTLSDQNFSFIHHKVHRFMKERRSLFATRRKNGRIRECHGDLHSGNIFIADNIYIFDAIEFNERFRYSDIASDIAFLAMDLKFQGKEKLAEFFLQRYLNYSGEEKSFLDILPFYECYRSYVRGKVTSFRLNDPNITDMKKKGVEKLAAKYFRLSYDFATQL